MERIVLRHLSGSKANQVEEFPLSHVPEVVLGRDPNSTVKYDPDRDDLVGRQHAKITRDATDPNVFNITDLRSRNGTYVNKQKIADTVRIVPGDLIQLGPGGPEVQFDLEPRPEGGTVRATREALSDPMAPTLSNNPFGTIPIPTTRTVDLGSDSSGLPRTTVGKATVERMITETVTQTKKAEGRRYMMIGGGALIGVLILFGAIAGYLAYRGQASEAELGKVQKEMASAPLTPSAITKANERSVVKIEVSWKLVSPSGGPVFQRYINNVREAKKGKKPGYYVNEAGAKNLPCYVYFKDDKRIEPLLTYENSGYSQLIGGQYTGTGFVVNDRGFILTTRSLAKAWENSYPRPENIEFGVLYDAETKEFIRILRENEIPAWVPSQTKQDIDGQPGAYTGINDSIYVSFYGQNRRVSAQVTTASPEHDVALIKVDLPNPVPKVSFNNNYDTIQQGHKVYMLGYSADSAPVFYAVRSKDDTSRGTELIEIPAPTFNEGSIGKVIRGKEASGNAEGIVSKTGDYYELTLSTTRVGNSGSPIFDDHGNVIAIFSTSNFIDNSRTYAVPIKFGAALMSMDASPGQ